jgi:hypothetical protein
LIDLQIYDKVFKTNQAFFPTFDPMLLFLFYTLLITLLLKKFNFFRTTALSGWGIYLAFAAKLGIALFFFAFPYNTMIDSGHYMHDADALSRVLYESPGDFLKIFLGFGDVENLNTQYLSSTTYWSHDKGWIFSDTRNVIRVNAIFHWLAFHNPRVVLLFNVLVCLIGLRLFYQGLSQLVKTKKNLLFLLIFFLPSTLLWTANLSKEAFLLVGFGLLMRNIFTGKQLHFSSFIGILILLMFKPYVGAAFLLAWLVYVLLMLSNRTRRWAGLGIFIFSGIVFLGISRTKIAQFISQKQFDFINLAEGGIWLEVEGSAVRINDADTIHLQIHEAENKNFYALIEVEVVGEKRVHQQMPEKIKVAPSEFEYYVLHRLPKSGSYIDLHNIDGEFSKLLKSAPHAIFNVMFRPLPSDPPKSIVKWYFVLESYLLVALFLFALTKIRANSHRNTIIFLFLGSILIALIIGWTTPVLGAIVRYKLPITLSLIAASYLLLFPQKEQQKSI